MAVWTFRAARSLADLFDESRSLRGVRLLLPPAHGFLQRFLEEFTMRYLIVPLLAFFAIVAHAGVKIDHWQTANGARVYFVANDALPILDIEVSFAAGTAYEPPAKAGLASLTRGLLDTGADDLDEEAIAARLVDLGARLGGSLDTDRASLSLRTLTDAELRSGAIELMALLLARPSFPPAVLAREAARTMAAIREADTRPEAIAAKRFTAAIYPGHPYGLIPTVDTVAAVTRDDLIDFHRRHYSAVRATVAMIGAISRAEAEAIADRLTRDLPVGAPLVALPKVSPPGTAVLRYEHPATQAHIHIGLPLVRRSDEAIWPLLVGNYILGGGGFVSRLMKEVREKRGYAYSVWSTFTPRLVEGPFLIALQTRREQTGEALQVARQVLDDFIAQGPTAKELAAAKKNLIDGQALRIDSNAKLLGYLTLIGFYGLPLDYLDQFAHKIAAVRAEDVRRVFAERLRPEHRLTVIVAGD